jgi:pyruvate/2-oxoglutarate dehydrogenase complex dihydrolipoamide acyltransferase (E2) component
MHGAQNSHKNTKNTMNLSGGTTGRTLESSLYGRGEAQPSHLLPISPMRRAIATRLLESKQQIPHFYIDISCDMTKLVALRQEINEIASNSQDSAKNKILGNSVNFAGAVKISVNDLVVRAVAHVISRPPSPWPPIRAAMDLMQGRPKFSSHHRLKTWHFPNRSCTTVDSQVLKRWWSTTTAESS